MHRSGKQQKSQHDFHQDFFKIHPANQTPRGVQQRIVDKRSGQQKQRKQDRDHHQPDRIWQTYQPRIQIAEQGGQNDNDRDDVKQIHGLKPEQGKNCSLNRRR